ncbi:hypothetical protein ACSDQ9_12835 [Aestuariimicrobium soli]|uniref:hypothetical protein n=1 Tax=Aestuariimicrobium soli TaxID=2035834 RepID=UPI003EBEFEE5
MSQQPQPQSSSAVPGVNRLRPALAWGLVGLTVASYLVAWISGLTQNGGGGLRSMSLYSGGGLTTLTYALPALAALIWSAAGSPRLDVKVPSLVLAATLAFDVVTGLGFGVVALSNRDWRFGTAAYDLLELLAKAGAAVVAYLLATQTTGGRVALPPANQTPSGQRNQAVQPYQQGQPPTWQPDQASGGAWLRAGDAASGASASTWGTPGASSQGSASWQPQQPQQQWNPQTQQTQNQQPQNQQPQQQWPATGQPDPWPQPHPADEEEGTVLRPAPQWPQQPRD